MRACLSLCVVSALVGAALADCTACIGGQCYRKHILPVSDGINQFLDIDRNRNILYMSDRNMLKQCHLDTLLCNVTTHKNEIRWLAVDQLTGDTYGIIKDDLGPGLYKINLKNNEHKLLINTAVYYLRFKDKLYYTPWSGNGIFTYENGSIQAIAGTEEYFVFNFVVDKHDDIYFNTIDQNGDYIIRRLSQGVIDETAHWDRNHLITIDKEGDAVIIHSDTHTVVYKATNGQLAEIGDIGELIDLNNVFQTPLFDRDNNIVYETKSFAIAYMKPDKNMQCFVTISGDTRFINETVASTENDEEQDGSFTTKCSSPDVDVEVISDMFSAPEVVVSSSDGSGVSCPAAYGGQARRGLEKQSVCLCDGATSPKITIELEFN